MAPDQTPCDKPRGHKRRQHTAVIDGRRRHWEQGVNKAAVWVLRDDGRMSEADYQTWGRL